MALESCRSNTMISTNKGTITEQILTYERSPIYLETPGAGRERREEPPPEMRTITKSSLLSWLTLSTSLLATLSQTTSQLRVENKALINLKLSSALFQIVINWAAHSVVTPALLCHKEPAQGRDEMPPTRGISCLSYCHFNLSHFILSRDQPSNQTGPFPTFLFDFIVYGMS